MQEVMKQLESIASRGYDARRVFDDWLDLMLTAFTGNESEYLKIVRKYRNDGTAGKREIDHFSYATGALMAGMEKTNLEMLGDIYMAWNVNNKYAGQYFTPPNVAVMMAKMTISGPGCIGDPACGSGIMLISAAKEMTAEQVSESLFVGQDIDETCVKMCALNMMFFNLDGLALCGDSLAREVRSGFETRRTSEGGVIRQIPEEELPSFGPVVEALQKQAAIKTFGWEEAKQLTLAI